MTGRSGVAVHRHNARRAVSLTVDGESQRRCCGVAITIRDRVGVTVREALAGLKCVHRRVGVVKRISVAAVRIKDECPVGERHARRTHRVGLNVGADGVVREHITAHRVRARVFGNACRIGRRRRDAVDDVDGERARCRDTKGIGYRQGDRIQGVGSIRLVEHRLEGIAVVKCARGGVVAC